METHSSVLAWRIPGTAEPGGLPPVGSHRVGHDWGDLVAAAAAAADVFLELSCFFNDSVDAGNLISGSSAFSKSSFKLWKFLVHVLLNPGLENFDDDFASDWGECNGVLVWTFFGIAFLGNWNENWPFPVVTAGFSKFAGILSRALSQHHLLGREIASLEFYHLH